MSNSSVGTAAYVTGIDTDSGQFVARVGFTETGTGVGSARTGGKVVYAARYGHNYVTTITRTRPSNSTDGRISGWVRSDGGTLLMTADFNTNTLTGRNSDLDVDGRISGRDLSGTVDVTVGTGASPFPTGTATVTTSLDGLVGTNGVIGSYQGTNGDDITVAGGFVGR